MSNLSRYFILFDFFKYYQFIVYYMRLILFSRQIDFMASNVKYVQISGVQENKELFAVRKRVES